MTKKPDPELDEMLRDLRQLRGQIGRLTAEQLMTLIVKSGPDMVRESPEDAATFMTGLDSGLAMGLHHPRLAEAMLAAMRSAVAETVERHMGKIENVYADWGESEERWATVLNVIFNVEDRPQ